MRLGKLQAADFSDSAKRFHLYAQFVTAEQMRATLAACRKRGQQFYLDLPLGVHSAGYDTWRDSDLFALHCDVGAPPDPVFTKGQNWGFAPLHPEKIRQRRYRYVIDYLRFQMQHTGMLRIDHVMGLHRLYWIPSGMPASQGAYINYHADELHAIFSLESHRNKTMLVGENLGTVPPEVTKAMDRHGLRKMFVVQYEQRPSEPPATPPALSVASLNTHDMPPFSAVWRGDDLKDRNKLRLVPNLKTALQERSRMNSTLVDFLRTSKLLPEKQPDALAVIHRPFKMVGGESRAIGPRESQDLWGETKPQNVPGTSVERPNWKRKSALGLEQIISRPDLSAFLRELTKIRNGTSKAPSRKEKLPFLQPN